MGIFKLIEWHLGVYKYSVPILKMRAGQHPVWLMDHAKRVKNKSNIYFELYKTPPPDNKFPPPRSNEIFINTKGKDVFPKVHLDDGTFVPLTFQLGEETVYNCKGCGQEYDSTDAVIIHVRNCDKVVGNGYEKKDKN